LGNAGGQGLMGLAANQRGGSGQAHAIVFYYNAQLPLLLINLEQ